MQLLAQGSMSRVRLPDSPVSLGACAAPPWMVEARALPSMEEAMAPPIEDEATRQPWICRPQVLQLHAKSTKVLCVRS
ncbi:hypothetical protein BDA96_03G106500 [Sorghum bicolor]|uniref:Uncharacterized protein n=2 Tax=Sorghum bicolor TaxID=4558 RepID=A0A921RAE2_SORBI|nr:hypothetical protein BDA96_03G106500 [Sorghum bicolor]KXG32107.1 hypothetical protein SORBI_3003G101600 [Sorghum bicolor]